MTTPTIVELPLALLSVYGDIITERSAWSWPDLQAISDQSEFLDHFKISTDQYTQLQQYASTRRSVGAFQPVSPSSSFLEPETPQISASFPVRTPDSAATIVPYHDTFSPTPQPKESSSKSNDVHGSSLSKLKRRASDDELLKSLDPSQSEPSDSRLSHDETSHDLPTLEHVFDATPSKRRKITSPRRAGVCDDRITSNTSPCQHLTIDHEDASQITEAERQEKIEQGIQRARRETCKLFSEPIQVWAYTCNKFNVHPYPCKDSASRTEEIEFNRTYALLEEAEKVTREQFRPKYQKWLDESRTHKQLSARLKKDTNKPFVFLEDRLDGLAEENGERFAGLEELDEGDDEVMDHAA